MLKPFQWLDTGNTQFPPLDSALAEPNGLLAIGGDLSPQRIIEAYKQGIFPWYNDGEPILWWYPSPRAILKFDDLYINKTLRKHLKRTPYTISVNKAFVETIDKCSNAPFRGEETWITKAMQLAYIQLHYEGYAHSVEVWQDSELVGGLYGIAINGYFSGESMFYQKANASKFALVGLCNMLADANVDFIDCQILNPFLASMGCKDVALAEFQRLQTSMLNLQVPSTLWEPRTL
ncbi:leucyl/phenylalanyl-tRNA--protein transferase [Thalassotalea fusca]